MLRNIFKTIRSFWKNRTISMINIFGLGVGLATCILLLMYIWMKAADKHHQELGTCRIGLILVKENHPLLPSMAYAMKTEFPEIIIRMLKYPMLGMILSYEDKKWIRVFNETNSYYVDSHF